MQSTRFQQYLTKLTLQISGALQLTREDKIKLDAKLYKFSKVISDRQQDTLLNAYYKPAASQDTSQILPLVIASLKVMQTNYQRKRFRNYMGCETQFSKVTCQGSNCS